MWYTLTVDGIPVGRVELTSAPRGVGRLVPLRAFAATGLQTVARRLGVALRLPGIRQVSSSVGARALTGALQQALAVRDRLGLVDFWGRSAALVNIMVVVFPRDNSPIVIARLREQAAPRSAELNVPPADPGHRSRPAA